jgi:predicted DNA-binding transcriptional regulator AlpA
MYRPYLNIHRVSQLTGLSPKEITRRYYAGQFPPPPDNASRGLYWEEDVIQDYCLAQLEKKHKIGVRTN